MTSWYKAMRPELVIDLLDRVCPRGPPLRPRGRGGDDDVPAARRQDENCLREADAGRHQWWSGTSSHGGDHVLVSYGRASASNLRKLRLVDRAVGILGEADRVLGGASNFSTQVFAEARSAIRGGKMKNSSSSQHPPSSQQDATFLTCTELGLLAGLLLCPLEMSSSEPCEAGRWSREIENRPDPALPTHYSTRLKRHLQTFDFDNDGHITLAEGHEAHVRLQVPTVFNIGALCTVLLTSGFTARIRSFALPILRMNFPEYVRYQLPHALWARPSLGGFRGDQHSCVERPPNLNRLLEELDVDNDKYLSAEEIAVSSLQAFSKVLLHILARGTHFGAFFPSTEIAKDRIADSEKSGGEDTRVPLSFVRKFFVHPEILGSPAWFRFGLPPGPVSPFAGSSRATGDRCIGAISNVLKDVSIEHKYEQGSTMILPAAGLYLGPESIAE